MILLPFFNASKETILTLHAEIRFSIIWYIYFSDTAESLDRFKQENISVFCIYEYVLFKIQSNRMLAFKLSSLHEICVFNNKRN